MINCLDQCGHLCMLAAMRRWAEAVTLWAAHAACLQNGGIIDVPPDARRRREPLRKATHALGTARARAAEERGAAMTLATAAEFATMLTATGPHGPQPPPGLQQLSPRERELVILVARHPDRRAALHQRPHRALLPGPHPRQDGVQAAS
jgi:hypothetical protein